MKRNIFTLSLLLLSVVAFAQEVISELKFNPQLYYKYKSLSDISGKRMAADKFIFSPDTLSIPFIDDFSRYHLKSYESPGNFPVAFSVNRSVALTDTVYEFSFMIDTTWTFVFDTTLQTADTIPNATIELTLQNDLSSNPEIVKGYPVYNIFDTLGNSADTIFLTPDSTIQYSVFYAVKDSNALWLDNYVYINDEYPANKLSYGVATFDGLNQYGLPHNNNSTDTYGPADTLTSQPINLQGLDTQKVYLSFVYEPMGLGYKPEVEDSLILEFKLIGSTWIKVWAIPGSDSIINNPEFKYVLIPLTNPFYFNEAFQFRFRNKASITGNNDHWHLDYVYLNKNRSAIDTIIKDVSVLNPATSFLKNYVSMPWNHFKGYESSEYVSPITLSWRNNFGTSQSMSEIRFRADELYSGNTLFQYEPGITDAPPANFDRYLVDPGAPAKPFSSDSFVPPFSPVVSDSLLFDIVTSFEVTGDLTKENNTVSSPILFKNYFAYDDGTAEKAYGLEPQGLLKFAYEFRLNHSDTLRAIEIYFAQVNDNLLTRQLTLMVWSSIDSNNTSTGDDTLYARPRTLFFYNPERNGFVTYRLDPPLVLDATVLSSDLKFYIGWQQLFSENVQIGLDLNNTATEHMFYYSSGTWKKSRVEGALMIRPIVGKYVEIFGTGTEEPLAAATDVLLYPNPAGNFIYMKLSRPVQWIGIYDMRGRLLKSILSSQERIDISDLSNGMYFLKGVDSEQTWTRKFVKQ